MLHSAANTSLLSNVLPHVAAPDRLRGKPVLIVHGTRDDTLSADYGRAVFQAVKQFPLSTEYLEFDMAHMTSEASLAAVSPWLTARLSAGWPDSAIAPNPCVG